MPRFNVEMRIDFQGEIEAESAEEAEKLAWTLWGDNSDAPITYDSVYSIDVEELEEEEEEEEEDSPEYIPELDGVYGGDSYDTEKNALARDLARGDY
jgi:hypothetical protein